MIWLTKLRRRISTGTTPGVKFLAKLVRPQNMTQNELCRRISNTTSLSEGDISNVIKSMKFEFELAFSEGRSIETELGIYQVQLKVKACDTLEEVTTETVEKVNIRYLLPKSIRRSLDKKMLNFAFVDVTPKGHQEVSDEGTNPIP